jgi:hypothetical protein
MSARETVRELIERLTALGERKARSRFAPRNEYNALEAAELELKAEIRRRLDAGEEVECGGTH